MITRERHYPADERDLALPATFPYPRIIMRISGARSGPFHAHGKVNALVEHGTLEAIETLQATERPERSVVQ